MESLNNPNPISSLCRGTIYILHSLQLLAAIRGPIIPGAHLINPAQYQNASSKCGDRQTINILSNVYQSHLKHQQNRSSPLTQLTNNRQYSYPPNRHLGTPFLQSLLRPKPHRIHLPNGPRLSRNPHLFHRRLYVGPTPTTRSTSLFHARFESRQPSRIGGGSE